MKKLWEKLSNSREYSFRDYYDRTQIYSDVIKRYLPHLTEEDAFMIMSNSGYDIKTCKILVDKIVSRERIACLINNCKYNQHTSRSIFLPLCKNIKTTDNAKLLLEKVNNGDKFVLEIIKKKIFTEKKILLSFLCAHSHTEIQGISLSLLSNYKFKDQELLLILNSANYTYTLDYFFKRQLKLGELSDEQLIKTLDRFKKNTMLTRIILNYLSDELVLLSTAKKDIKNPVFGDIISLLKGRDALLEALNLYTGDFIDLPKFSISNLTIQDLINIIYRSKFLDKTCEDILSQLVGSEIVDLLKACNYRRKLCEYALDHLGDEKDLIHIGKKCKMSPRIINLVLQKIELRDKSDHEIFQIYELLGV